MSHIETTMIKGDKGSKDGWDSIYLAMMWTLGSEAPDVPPGWREHVAERSASIPL